MHIPSSQTIRKWAFGSFLSLIAAIVLAIVTEFFVEVAREHGAYDHPSQKLLAILNFILHNPQVRSLAAGVLGVAFGVWSYSIALTKEAESRALAATLPKPDSRLAAIVKARDMANRIRYVLRERGAAHAAAYYNQFDAQAAITAQSLIGALGGIPPVMRDPNALGAYSNPRTTDGLNLVADDLELLADAVEENLRGI